MRKSIAPWVNLAVPGAGLILLRREWLGFALAMLFCLCAQIALWGLLIVPASIPGWITTAAFAGVGLVWIAAQYSLLVRRRRAFGKGVDREIQRLCQLAEEAVAQAEYERAEELILVALTLNDEDPGVNVLWAQLMTARGRFRQARRAWHRVVQLSHTAAERREALEALAALP
jgi:hypothetical protein